MGLPNGTRLGAYEVIAQIGMGGTSARGYAEAGTEASLLKRAVGTGAPARV